MHMITYISGGHRDVGVLSRIPVVKRIFSLDGLGVSGIKFNFITPKNTPARLASKSIYARLIL